MTFYSSSAYITEAEGESYLRSRGYEFTSDAATALGFILRAADYLDANYIYKGTKLINTQHRQFPRTGIEGVDPNTVPDEIKEANALLAYFIFSNPDLAIHGSEAHVSTTVNQEVKSEQVGDIKVTYETGTRTTTTDTTRSSTVDQPTIELPSIDKLLASLLVNPPTTATGITESGRTAVINISPG